MFSLWESEWGLRRQNELFSILRYSLIPLESRYIINLVIVIHSKSNNLKMSVHQLVNNVNIVISLKKHLWALGGFVLITQYNLSFRTIIVLNICFRPSACCVVYRSLYFHLFFYLMFFFPVLSKELSFFSPDQINIVGKVSSPPLFPISFQI